MSPPTFYSGAPTRKDGKKQAFSSTSLSSIDSQGPVSPNTNAPWDTETDHILSFFLSSGSEQMMASAVPDFASTHYTNPARGVPNVNVRVKRPVSKPTTASNDRMEEDEDDEVIPPSTPAVQFYAPTQALLSGAFQPRPLGFNTGKQPHHHHDSHNPPTGELTSASSSSSLSSMTANLISGGLAGYPPVLAPHQYHPSSSQHHQQQDFHMQQHMQMHPQIAELQASMTGGSSGSLHQSPGSHQSPISPAAMFGQIQENLMLPPARQQGQQSPLQPQYGSMSEQQQRHLAWLRDLNAMAKAAQQPLHHPSLSTSGPSQQQQQVMYQQQAHPQQQQQQQRIFHRDVPEGMLFPPGFIVPPDNKPQAVETAEKRAKRLERNRESARKSRRRKKEKLTTLEGQVNKLHEKIEAERRIQIGAMVTKLRKCRLAEITRVVADLQDPTHEESLLFVVQTTGPSSEIVRAVQDFQHNLLKQIVLPRFHKLLLWLTGQPESFFAAGRDEYNSRPGRNRTMQKVSSKLIGDELTNGPKEDDEDELLEAERNSRASIPKRVTFQDTSTAAAAAVEEKQPPEASLQLNLTTYANDAARVWPLLCYELSLSVDQEDKFVTFHKRPHHDDESLLTSRFQMTAAVESTDSLREATESLSRVMGQREERSMVEILNPGQVLLYQTWLASNRERCAELVAQRNTRNTLSLDSSLHDICRRLNDVMKVSMGEK